MSTSREHAGRVSDGFRELLEPGAITAVYQPIVRLADLQPIGYEGLARFPTPPGLVALPPDVTLAAADRAGLRGELEAACWGAIAAAGVPPAGRLLFVNVSPDLLGHGGFAALAGDMPSRLVIELTEQDAVQDIAQVREKLRPWIARGALVAVDDAGAGFTSLEYVAQIRPDFLKLCRGMVTGVDLDASRLAVLRATVAFAREVGARIVAEGVERHEELAVLRDAGIDFGQGWLFGRPSPAWPQDAESAPAAARRVATAMPPDDALEAADSVPAAANAVADELVRHGLIPGVYLEQGGRLRCQAARGSWQVADGIRPAAGLIGRAFRTGTEVGAAVPELAPALPAVVAQACVPLVVAGRVAGVLSAESPTPLREADVDVLRDAAARLGRRIDALGGVAPAAPDRALARTLGAIAALADPEDIVREVLAAARALSGFESALVALDDGHGSLYPHHAEGSFAVTLNQLDGAELARIAAWVDDGASCATAGEATGRGFAGHEPLRVAGSAVVLPMRIAGERLGVLLVVDRATRRPPTETVELLELLAVQAAAGLRMAAAVLELRERAARDPLTGLGHLAAFHAALPAGGGDATHRQALLLADIDGFAAINDARGQAAGDDVLRAAAGLLRAVAPPGGRAFRIGADEFALVFPCAGADDARRIGWALQTSAPARLGTTVSVGIAVGEPGEGDEILLARAGAALRPG
jgi:diguanylate cyclase (GGDEF)-like protein